jgi:ERCC4-related helicase
MTGETTSSLRKIIWSSDVKIVFATPQVVWNDISSGAASLHDFSLIVFDECHRAIKEYAYTKIAKHYVESSDYPLILALTASITHDIEKANEMCRSLYIEKIVFLDERDPSVARYINPVQIEWDTVELPSEYRAVSFELKEMLEERLKWLVEMKLLERAKVSKKKLIELSSILSEKTKLEPEKDLLFASISRVSQAIILSHMIDLLETQGAESLRRFLEVKEETTKARATLFNELVKRGIYNRLQMLGEHPKIYRMEELLKQFFEKNPESRALLFTQYRDTASKIVTTLNQLGIPTARFVGQNVRARDAGMSQEEQQETLNSFREGIFKVLVATSVAEEGLDIPEVNLVVFYEPIPSSIRYIQRRGRTGRKAPGKVVILAANGTSDIAYHKVSQLRLLRMRDVIESISKNLQKLVRNERPEPSPIPDKELQKIYKLAGEKREEYLEIKDEKEKSKELEGEIINAASEAYKIILSSGGQIKREDTVSKLEELGFRREIAIAALERVEEIKPDVKSSAKKIEIIPSEMEGYRARKIRIESIFQGHCIVNIDDRWMARLSSYDYDGPRHLIKKGKEFLALCKIYRQDRLCVRVLQVLREV